MSQVRRIYVEKKKDFAVKAKELKDEIAGFLGITKVTGVRVLIRYDVETLNGMNFVMHHALGGGATMSLRLDSLGKSMGSAVMRMRIHVTEGELQTLLESGVQLMPFEQTAD